MTTDVLKGCQLKEFDDLKKHLSGLKKQGADKNLYSHIEEIIDFIVVHCPDEALNKVEEISYLLKNQDTIALEEFLQTNDHKNYSMPSDESTLAATKEYVA
jgi:hypothetical protein